jgi:enediyne biosynthesis protein E4
LSKRQRLIWKFAALGGLPVLLVVVFMVGRRLLTDETYVPDQDEEGITRALDRSGPAGESGLSFTDATDEAGISFEHFPFQRTSQIPEDMGPGAAWGDYDNDGDPDLFLVNFAAPVGAGEAEMASSVATDRLFQNQGDGTFQDVTARAGVGMAHYGMGAAWGDYDSDGDLDLLVTAWGEVVLWENRGDGTFTDVSASAGLAGHGFWTGASWADFDRDGDLDAYVVGYVQYQPETDAGASTGDSDFPFTLNPSSYGSEPNRLFVNQGDGTFVEGSERAGVRDAEGKGMSAAWVDLDEDGWLDLYVANDVSDNRLYRSLGDGTFEDVSYQALVADYRGAMGIAVGDWDADLDQDLFITHWIAQENALYTSTLSELRGSTTAGTLNFGDDSDRVGLGQISLDQIGWATSFSDFNNDGWLDLWVANGSTMQQRGDRSRLVTMDAHLYWNRGGREGFFEVGDEVGFRVSPQLVGRGGAVADYDLDGDLDVLIMNVGGSAKLLRNDSEGGHWIGIQAEATTGHASALGARITAFVGARGFLREVGAGPSYLSQNDVVVSIGLGEATQVDSLVVVWPGGKREVWPGLPADRRYVLVEGSEPRRVAGAMSRDETQRFWALDREVAAHYNSGEWTEAAAGLTQMLDLNPDHWDSLYDLGNVLLELERYAEATAAWRRLVEVNPVSSRAWVQLGIVHTLPDATEIFDLGEAVAAFEAAHELNREESNALVLWGEAALAAGDVETSQRVLEAGYRMNDGATSALYLSGYLAWKRGDEAAATRLLTQALDAAGGLEIVEGESNEGDTRSARMDEIQAAAAARRLFSGCVQALRGPGVAPDPATLYPCVDAEVRRLASH